MANFPVFAPALRGRDPREHQSQYLTSLQHGANDPYGQVDNFHHAQQFAYNAYVELLMQNTAPYNYNEASYPTDLNMTSYSASGADSALANDVWCQPNLFPHSDALALSQAFDIGIPENSSLFPMVRDTFIGI